MEKIFFYREKKKGKAAKYSERERGSGIDAYMRAGRDAAMSTVPRHPPPNRLGAHLNASHGQFTFYQPALLYKHRRNSLFIFFYL